MSNWMFWFTVFLALPVIVASLGGAWLLAMMARLWWLSRKERR